jgi:hypothetical protein
LEREIKVSGPVYLTMAADDTVQLSLRKSTVEMIRGYDPGAASLDDAIEEMVLDHPPTALLEELTREAKGPFVTRDDARRKHGY